MADVSTLARIADTRHVAVVGAGFAGLLAAYEFAKVGMHVTVFEAADRPGGAYAPVALEELTVTATGATFRDETNIHELLAELRLDDQRRSARTTARCTNLQGALVPLPANVLGIPANPFQTKVIGIIGWGGAWRAYLDRLRPPLTIGHERDLTKLVGKRLGSRVLQRLTAPVVRAEYGLSPADIDVDAAVPELNAALTSQGSLTGAAGAVLEERENDAPQTIAGGMHTLIAALLGKLSELGAQVRLGVEVLGVHQHEDGVLLTTVDDVEPSAFDAVVIAAPQQDARTLLQRPASQVPRYAPTTATDVVALVERGSVPEVGAGCTPQLATGMVWRIDDEKAQWGTPDGPQVLRVRVAGDDAELTPARLETLLGDVLPGTPKVRACVATVHELPLALAATGAQEQLARFREETRDESRIAVVGPWLAGAGVSSVIADTVTETERIRRPLLFQP